MDSNETAVVIVSPPLAYHYTPGTTTFGQITDSDFTSRGAGDVEFCDNFMLFREPATGRVFGADLGSVTAFNGLSFFTASRIAGRTIVGSQREADLRACLDMTRDLSSNGARAARLTASDARPRG